jgi:hypothetical protein
MHEAPQYAPARRSFYSQRIREEMARLGRIAEQPAHIVEAWMRIEHSTLDGLSASAFRKEVGIALDCAAVSSISENDSLAASFGLVVRS